jgi:predicted MPP superfamily phosphohydrolase
MVSDLHITSYTRQASMQKLVDRLNAIDADIVVFVGDIVDGDVRPYEEKGVPAIFQGIKSRHGFYGVLGNHEYHGGAVDKAVELFTASGMTLLRDQVAVIDALNLSILGRDDSRVRRITGSERLSATELIATAKDGSLLLSLDHQPQLAMEAKEAGVDLQLSGHTHNGQVFPANLIVKKIYDNPWGHKTYDAVFDLIVSCGYGTWGPPMRTRSFSEIVVLELIGK